MKRILKPLICLVLCFSVVLSFISCQYIDPIIDKITGESDNGEQVEQESDDNESIEKEPVKTDSIVPKGYTGGMTGDTHFHEEYGVYWLETYEEVLEAVELLKSHGSTIQRSIAFNCEGELLDSKYCFIYPRSKAEPLEEGKNFFDRKMDGVEFSWYAFCDKDVAIDDFLYYQCVIWDYDVIYIKYTFGTWWDRDFSNIENTDELSISWFGKGVYADCEEGPPPQDDNYRIIMHNDYEYAYLTSCVIKFSEKFIPEDYYDEFLSTFVIIE